MRSPRKRREGLPAPLVAALGLAAAALAAYLLPAALRPLAVVAAFVLGAWVGQAALTGSRAWARTLTAPRIAVASVAVLAAAAFVFVPGSSGPAVDDEPAERAQAPPPAAPAVTEPIRTIDARIGRAVIVDRVRFKAFVPDDDDWARAIRRRPAPRGMRWVVLGVKATNRGRERFNGNLLAYRLRAAGVVYAPILSGGSGPEALGRSGSLPKGSSSVSRLAFRVPRAAPAGVLLFEPSRNGDAQVRVALDGA